MPFNLYAFQSKLTPLSFLANVCIRLFFAAWPVLCLIFWPGHCLSVLTMRASDCDHMWDVNGGLHDHGYDAVWRVVAGVFLKMGLRDLRVFTFPRVFGCSPAGSVPPMWSI